ncbi:hypothetical protein GCM10027348_01960 [Hymenobacter tenuis]
MPVVPDKAIVAQHQEAQAHGYVRIPMFPEFREKQGAAGNQAKQTKERKEQGPGGRYAGGKQERMQHKQAQR